MSRKKKTNEVEQKSSTPLEYSGKVTLQLAKGNKVLKTVTTKNTGTLNLFQGIALFLTGYGNITNMYPQYIDVGTGTDPNNINMVDLQKSLLNTRVSITSVSQNISLTTNNEPNGYVASFTGVVPFTALTDVLSIREIGLFYTANTSGTMLARIVLDEDIEILTGFNLIITWEMSIINKEGN